MCEIYKISRTSFYWILFGVSITLTFLAALMYYDNSFSNTRYNFEYSKYDTFIELQELINDCNDDIAGIENDFEHDRIDYDTYIHNLSRFIKKKEIYQFLFENKISYTEFRLSNEISMFSDDKVAYIKSFVIISQLPLVIIMIIVNLKLFNEDFSLNTSRYVYTRNISKSKIVSKKTVASFFVVGIITLFLFLIMFVTAITYEASYMYILVYKDNQILNYTVNQYLIGLGISLIFEIIFWNTVFITIGLLIKKTLPTGILNVLLVTISLTLLYTINAFGFYFMNIMSLIENVNNLDEVWIYMITRIMVMISILPISIIKFQRSALE